MAMSFISAGLSKTNENPATQNLVRIAVLPGFVNAQFRTGTTKRTPSFLLAKGGSIRLRRIVPSVVCG